MIRTGFRLHKTWTADTDDRTANCPG